MGTYQKPTEANSQNRKTFANYVLDSVKVTGGVPRTTSSMQGTPQYAATSFSVSDILQGTFNVKNQSDTLLVVNKALTQNLSGLYDRGADSISSFSTVPASGSLTGVAPIIDPETGESSAGAAGTGLNSDGITVSRTFVTGLPLDHPTTKAIIWNRQGKASREMHIPTDPDMTKDKSQHIQYEGMRPEWKHPWNMDRVGGWIGGESFVSGPLDTGTIGGEDASVGGQSGALGMMDPIEEQFYCSMAWPLDADACKKAFIKAGVPEVNDRATAAKLKYDAYRHKRVMVYSVTTQKGVVCCPGDWGPNPYWSNGAASKGSISGFYIGLSPDTHFALGTDHGTEVILGWMPDDTPVGPYTTGNGIVAAPSATPGGTAGSIAGGTAAASGGGGQNTIEELIYAGTILANHPNMWIARHKAMKTLLTQGTFSSDHPNFVLYKGSDGRQFLMPSLLNFLFYIVEGGFIVDNFLGAIGYKTKAGDRTNTQVSNHATGGAIDIGSLGKASLNASVGYNDPSWRAICDEMFGYLATLPPDIRGEEIGCSFAADYANGFHVYKDAHPTHLHLGFDVTEAGSLIPALKKKPPRLPTGVI